MSGETVEEASEMLWRKCDHCGGPIEEGRPHEKVGMFCCAIHSPIPEHFRLYRASKASSYEQIARQALVEKQTMFENLTSTQARCTQLLESERRLVAENEEARRCSEWAYHRIVRGDYQELLKDDDTGKRWAAGGQKEMLVRLGNVFGGCFVDGKRTSPGEFVTHFLSAVFGAVPGAQDKSRKRETEEEVPEANQYRKMRDALRDLLDASACVRPSIDKAATNHLHMIDTAMDKARVALGRKASGQ